jgi:hypothetical protein
VRNKENEHIGSVEIMRELPLFKPSRGIRSLILLGLLTGSVILALSPLPVKGGTLQPTMTRCPPFVTRGDSFEVYVSFNYEFDGTGKYTTYYVRFKATTPGGGKPVFMYFFPQYSTKGAASETEPIDLFPFLGEINHHYAGTRGESWSIVVPGDKWAPPSDVDEIVITAWVGREWPTVPEEEVKCFIRLMGSQDPPVVVIDSADVYNASHVYHYPGNDLGDVQNGRVLHSGEIYRLRVDFHYFLPALSVSGTKLFVPPTFTMKYRDLIKGEWETETESALSSPELWTYTSGATEYGHMYLPEAHTPLDYGFGSVAGWKWELELTLDAGSLGKASDSYTFTLNVVRYDQMRFYIYKVTAPSSIPDGAQFNVQAEGAYYIPQGQTATIQVSLYNSQSAPYFSNAPPPHQLDKLAGTGAWSEIFTAASSVLWYGKQGQSTVEGPWQYGHSEIVLYETKDHILDFMAFKINVTKAQINKALPSYCHITDVKHPSEVTHGQDVTVTVELERKLSKGSSLAISIWDKNLFPQQNGELASDMMKDAEGTGSTSVTIKIPGANVRPENGPWALQAVSVCETPETGKLSPDKFDFTVNVVGASGPKGAGGKTDWSIDNIQAMPFQPTQDEPTIFQAMVKAVPAPTDPVQVQVVCRLDGTELFGGYVNYGANMGFVVVFSQPWKATLGAHTLACDVGPNQNYDDQNKVNNHRELKFAVTKSYTPPPPPPEVPQAEFDFYVTATPTEQTLASSVTFAVNVKLVSGTVQPVQLELSNVPAGISYSFAPSSGAPPYDSTLTLTGAAGLPAGTYSLTIKASGGQGQLYKERYKPLTLIVKSGPTYSLSITPDTAQAQPGENVTFTVSASSDTGYPDFVNLILAGAPNGSLAKLEPSALTAPSQSTLTLELGKDVKPAVYLLVVAGSGPGGQSAVATLSVIGPPAPSTPQPTENEDLIVNGLAAGILGAIITAIAAGTFLAFRRFKAGRAKVYCIECGAQIPASLPYCRHCGAEQPQQGKEH